MTSTLLRTSIDGTAALASGRAASARRVSCGSAIPRTNETGVAAQRRHPSAVTRHLRRRALPWRDLVLVGELLGRFLHHRPHDIAHRLDPVGDEFPLFAVPLLEDNGAVTLVIAAGHLDRLHHLAEAELLQAVCAEVEVLHTLPHLLTGDLRPILLDGIANRLRGDHGVDQAAIVKHLADLVGARRTLALIVDELPDVLVDLEVLARRMERGRDKALGSITRGQHVGLAARPPDGNNVVHLETDRRRFLHADLVHHAPAAENDPVRTRLTNLEPRCLLLLPGMIDREVLNLEAILFREHVEDGDRLLA